MFICFFVSGVSGRGLKAQFFIIGILLWNFFVAVRVACFRIYCFARLFAAVQSGVGDCWFGQGWFCICILAENSSRRIVK